MVEDNYPRWFTDLDVVQVELVVITHRPPPLTIAGRTFSRRYRSDADACAALLAQCQAFADVLHQHRDRDPRELRRAARRFRDALIMYVDPFRPNDTWPTLKAFTVAIDQALAKKPWWPAAPTPKRARRSRPSYPNRAACLKPLMRGLTAYKFHQKYGGPDPKSLRKILAGDAVSDDVLTKLVDALQAAGHRVVFDQIPRD